MLNSINPFSKFSEVMTVPQLLKHMLPKVIRLSSQDQDSLTRPSTMDGIIPKRKSKPLSLDTVNSTASLPTYRFVSLKKKAASPSLVLTSEAQPEVSSSISKELGKALMKVKPD